MPKITVLFMFDQISFLAKMKTQENVSKAGKLEK